MTEAMTISYGFQDSAAGFPAMSLLLRLLSMCADLRRAIMSALPPPDYFR